MVASPFAAFRRNPPTTLGFTFDPTVPTVPEDAEAGELVGTLTFERRVALSGFENGKFTITPN